MFNQHKNHKKLILPVSALIVIILLICIYFTENHSSVYTYKIIDESLNPNKQCAITVGDTSDVAMARIFLPPPPTSKQSRRAVLICPGGGYSHLAIDYEGYQWGEFFNRLGIVAVVLKYRMPNGDAMIPISDAEEALRLIHHNSKVWHIDVSDIGIMGFSAGGHLVSTVVAQVPDEIRPNFQILFYPVISMDESITHKGSRNNLIGNNPEPNVVLLYSNEKQVSQNTPRTFMALCDNDSTVSPINAISYYLELHKHSVPATMHIYPEGKHGWGFLKSFKYHDELLLSLEDWLRSF